MVGERCRLVFSQNGSDVVSSVVMSLDEARESLVIEAQMHAAFGWTVTVGDDVIVARRGAVVRAVTFRTFTPHDDGDAR